MSAHGGPNIVEDGLVLSLDAANIKSFRGEPTTNFYTNGHFSGGSGITQEGGSNATNTIIEFLNPGDSPYVLEQSMGLAITEYQINLTSELASSTTYCLSGWYAESPDYSSADGSRMFHCRAFSSSGNHVALGNGIGTVLQTRVINGITWKYCYTTITTPADYSNIFNWYVGYGENTYTGKRYYTNLQMELGSYPKWFVNGTRGTTVATGGGWADRSGNSNHGELINGPTYSSNGLGGLVFDGTNDYISLGTSFTNGYINITVSFWVYVYSDSGRQDIVVKYPGGNGWFVYYGGGGSNIFGVDGRESSAAYFNNNTTNTYLGNNWYNVVFTKNGTNWRLYINSILDMNNTNGNGTTAFNNNGILGIGGPLFSDYGKCNVSDVKIYNRALSASEVLQNYNATKGRFGL
jgi:hypothetical protein